MIQIENPSVAHQDKKVQGLGYAPDYLIQDLAEIPDIIAKENAKNNIIAVKTDRPGSHPGLSVFCVCLLIVRTPPTGTWGPGRWWGEFW